MVSGRSLSCDMTGILEQKVVTESLLTRNYEGLVWALWPHAATPARFVGDVPSLSICD